MKNPEDNNIYLVDVYTNSKDIVDTIKSDDREALVFGVIKTSRNPELIARWTPDFKFSLYSYPGSQKFALKSNHPTLTFFELQSRDLTPFFKIFFFEIFSIIPLDEINILTFELLNEEEGSDTISELSNNDIKHKFMKNYNNIIVSR